MVEVTEVTETYSRTVQLEEYEPLRIESSVTGTVEDGETVEEASNVLYNDARERVERRVTHRMAAKRMEDDRADE